MGRPLGGVLERARPAQDSIHRVPGLELLVRPMESRKSCTRLRLSGRDRAKKATVTRRRVVSRVLRDKTIQRLCGNGSRRGGGERDKQDTNWAGHLYRRQSAPLQALGGHFYELSALEAQLAPPVGQTSELNNQIIPRALDGGASRRSPANELARGPLRGSSPG